MVPALMELTVSWLQHLTRFINRNKHMALSNCRQHCKKQTFHIIHHCYSEIVNKTIIFEVCSHGNDMVQNVQQM